MNRRYKWEIKIQRKIKLIRTLPSQEKMRWAGYVLIVAYFILWYLKGT